MKKKNYANGLRELISSNKSRMTRKQIQKWISGRLKPMSFYKRKDKYRQVCLYRMKDRCFITIYVYKEKLLIQYEVIYAFNINV